ncbi:hypothetical protein SAY87_031260 [Trapa incisa]|uniref:Uncharacterized protein n=1 Tax=Trapa incisa TaxID=236973 RepID=A0AAN7KK93_9MYRT|nr:hypothetical protein SAY87_031260 [Trapa incisa]
MSSTQTPDDFNTAPDLDSISLMESDDAEKDVKSKDCSFVHEDHLMDEGEQAEVVMAEETVSEATEKRKATGESDAHVAKRQKTKDEGIADVEGSEEPSGDTPLTFPSRTSLEGGLNGLEVVGEASAIGLPVPGHDGAVPADPTNDGNFVIDDNSESLRLSPMQGLVTIGLATEGTNEEAPTGPSADQSLQSDFIPLETEDEAADQEAVSREAAEKRAATEEESDAGRVKRIRTKGRRLTVEQLMAQDDDEDPSQPSRQSLLEGLDATALEEDQPSSNPILSARDYQLAALSMAVKQNTIVYLDTGAGKTRVATMLLRIFSHNIRKPSQYIAVFLVPKVVLVQQDDREMNWKIGMYWGSSGVDFSSSSAWKEEIEQHEILVMTPKILLSGLRHCYLKMEMIKVLIFDECQHASGKHPYACIMREFYHHALDAGITELPRILGLTASPINSKCCQPTSSDYWVKLQELETLMNSKIYTYKDESVVSKYIPFSEMKYREYEKMEKTHPHIEKLLSSVKEEAADFLTRGDSEDLICIKFDLAGDKIVKKFIWEVFNKLSTHVHSDPTIADDLKLNVDAGYLSNKVVCLVETLSEYRHIEDIRCIVFVERVITASAIQTLLNELLPNINGWRAKAIAGNNSGILRQSRKQQNEIVKEFRDGKVNIIVATSILEEGLDVQSCNLVIRFDPAPTISSFIQSRGRARRQDSELLLLVEKDDSSVRSRMETFLASGNIMRKESLSHASVPCAPLNDKYRNEDVYRVESTGAVVTLSSSVELLYFYCSRLPSDGYYKPTPRFIKDEEKGVCTLILPKNCPVPSPPPVYTDNKRSLQQIACFEACKHLHRYGALTDDLVPADVAEDKQIADAEKEPYFDEHPTYFPPELVNTLTESNLYHLYFVELVQTFTPDIQAEGLVLAIRTELEHDMEFNLQGERGKVNVKFIYAGTTTLTEQQVIYCRKFQGIVLSLLIDHSIQKSVELLRNYKPDHLPAVDYLVLPLLDQDNAYQKRKVIIDWTTITSVIFPAAGGSSAVDPNMHVASCNSEESYVVVTKDGPVCSCLLHNSVIYTPHNGVVYCITGFSDELNANSDMPVMRDGSTKTYKEHFKDRHNIDLCCEDQWFVKGRHIFRVHNYLSESWLKEREYRKYTIHLPPEICNLLISPISISTIYTYTFVPSILHRLGSLLLVTHMKEMFLDHGIPDIPTVKLLEAVTAKQCQEEFHLESLETLGDSFLKYVVTQELFKSHENHHEGMLTLKRQRLTSNAALCKFGCERKLPGFMCIELFDPKNWIAPGYKSPALISSELVSGGKVYAVAKRRIKLKKIADVVEALIGAYVSAGGENAGIMFLDWLGIKVDFKVSPYDGFKVNAARIIEVKVIEEILNYTFKKPALLVEALTHGSFSHPDIPGCYQRLEFLGDSVLDYLITVHLYNKYPGLSPGKITDMRSASVNNDCYGYSVCKAGLHRHILHASHTLGNDITKTVGDADKFEASFTYGWESDISFPKVLGDVIESIAGAIFLDSGNDKQQVFDSIRPLLEPMVTPETVQIHPVRELGELCQKHNYILKAPKVSPIAEGGIAVTIEVDADGVTHSHTSCYDNKKTGQRVASREVVKSLKEALLAKSLQEAEAAAAAASVPEEEKAPDFEDLYPEELDELEEMH